MNGQDFYPAITTPPAPTPPQGLPTTTPIPMPGAGPQALAPPKKIAAVANPVPVVVAPQTGASSADQAYLDAAKNFDAQKPPEYDAPKYKAPTRLEEAIPAILGLLFPGSKIANVASSFSSGLQGGAQQAYGRKTEEAKQKYDVEKDNRNAQEAHVRNLGTIADAQDRIKEQADAAAQRAEEAAETRKLAIEKERDHHQEVTQRLKQYARGLDEKADQIGINKERLKVDTWHYGQQIEVAQQRNAITEEDANRASSLRYQLGMLMETGRDSRYSTSVQVAQARTKASTINAGLTNGIKGILAGTDTPEVQQQKIGQLISQANEAVSGLYAGISSQHPELARGSEFDTVDTGETVNGEPMTGDYRPGSSAVDVMREAEAERMRAGGGGAPPGVAGGPGSVSGEYAWENQPLRTGAAQPVVPAGGAQPPHANTPPAQPHLPNGPGAAPDDFKIFTTVVSQHAKDFNSPQALMTAMAAVPTFASLSGAQAQQLVTMWQKTRQAHGEPTASTATAAQPAAPSGAATHAPAPAPSSGQAPPPVPERLRAPPPAWAQPPAAAPRPSSSAAPGPTPSAGAAPSMPPRTAQGPPALPPIADVIAAAGAAQTRGAAIQAVAKSVDVDSALLEAMMTSESSGSNSVVSPHGARGFGQLMPGTAHDLGVDPNDPVQNMAGSAVYLRQMLDRFKTIPRALAAYNAGPDAVVQARGGIPPIPETRAYVQTVMARYLARRRQEERVADMGGQQRGNI